MKKYPILLSAFFGLILVAGCQDSGFESKDIGLKTREAAAILPPNADVIASIDVSSSAGALTWLDQSDGRSDAALAEFESFTGINPKKDVDDVFFALTEGAQPIMNMVVYARFDSGRLKDFIVNEAGDRLTHSQSGGADVYCSTGTPDDKPEMCLSIINDEMIVAASGQEQIEIMLNRLAGNAPNVFEDSEMMELLGHTAGHDGAWAIGRGLDFSSADTESEGSDFPNPAKLVKSGVALTTFSANGMDLTFKGFAQDGVTTSDLSDVVKGFVSAARLGIDDSSDTAEDMRSVLDAAVVESRSDYVEVRVSLPASLLNKN